MDHAILHGKRFSNPLIMDHRGTIQTRFAQELHQNAGVPLGPCGIEEAKQFQAYLADYQISIVSKEYGNKIIYAGPEKDKKIYLYMDNSHYDVITKMLDFSPAFTIAIRATKPTRIRKSIGVPTTASAVGLLPSALKCPG